MFTDGFWGFQLRTDKTIGKHGDHVKVPNLWRREGHRRRRRNGQSTGRRRDHDGQRQRGSAGKCHKWLARRSPACQRLPPSEKIELDRRIGNGDAGDHHDAAERRGNQGHAQRPPAPDQHQPRGPATVQIQLQAEQPLRDQHHPHQQPAEGPGDAPQQPSDLQILQVQPPEHLRQQQGEGEGQLRGITVPTNLDRPFAQRTPGLNRCGQQRRPG